MLSTAIATPTITIGAAKSITSRASAFASASRTCRGRSCRSPVAMCSRSDIRTSTHENKSWTHDVLLQRSDNALAFELVLASQDMLLLIIESAKDICVLTRIQKTNEMNVILPIMIGTKIAALFIIIELATMKLSRTAVKSPFYYFLYTKLMYCFYTNPTVASP